MKRRTFLLAAVGACVPAPLAACSTGNVALTGVALAGDDFLRAYVAQVERIYAAQGVVDSGLTGATRNVPL